MTMFCHKHLLQQTFMSAGIHRYLTILIVYELKNSTNFHQEFHIHCRLQKSISEFRFG